MSLAAAGAFVRALRPRQWVKNALVFAAPVAARTLDETEVLVRSILAFVVFTVAAGSTYLVNDAADVAIDRLHPTKRHRPIASGALSQTVALRLGVALALASMVAAFGIAPLFGLVIAIYLALNAWYSRGMKHLPVIELCAIAMGFILRAVGGGAATDTPLSLWFVLVVCAVSLFVVTGKRSAELERTGGDGSGRPVLAHYTASGLRAGRAASAAVAVLAYAMWVFAQDLANDWWAGVSLLPFAAALARYNAVIEAGRGEDPEDVLLGDRLFQILALAWVVVYGVALYG